MISWTPVAAYLAGAATSVGPCVAPRFIALAGIVAGSSRAEQLRRTVAFVAGVCASYLCLAASTSLLRFLGQNSTLIYAGIAIVLLVAGVRGLADGAGCGQNAPIVPRQGGSAFLLGLGGALAISPCCAPAIAVFSAAGAAFEDPLADILTVCAYALGHCSPLFAIGVVGNRMQRLVQRIDCGEAVSVVASALTIALSGYYAVLA